MRPGYTLSALGAAVLLAAVLGCSRHASAPGPTPSAYLTDARFRRSELLASLVNPANDYSVLRLAHYDTGDAADWSRLPEYNPRTESVLPSELDAPGGAQPSAAMGPGALARDTKADLRALGEDAFFHYPTQLARVSVAVASRAAASRYGLWVDEATHRGVGGIVRVELADGTRGFAYTCATCHARAAQGGGGGALAVGVGNDSLDVGRMIVDASRGVPKDLARRYLSWGPGRVDVTTADGTEPVRIPDLRPTRWLTNLHHGGAVLARDVETLAIRLETLIVTSNNMVLRPPREVALGLATYLWSLGDTLPLRAPKTASEERGAALFASGCTQCHAPPGYAGRPVALAVVGTDPALGSSSTRGTGGYRVPSLRGVSTRGMLLHDASLPSIEAMFDPGRVASTYAGGRLGPGAVPGHTFGLDLGDTERADLLAFLRTL